MNAPPPNTPPDAPPPPGPPPRGTPPSGAPRPWWRGLVDQPRDWRLGTRFAVLFALVAAVTIALVGTLAYTTAASLIRTDAREEFDRTVEGLSEELVARHASGGTESVGRALVIMSSGSFQAQYLSPVGTRSVTAADPDQVVILPSDERDLEIARDTEPGVTDVREVNVEGRDFRLATVSFGAERGAIQLLQPLSPVEAMIDRLATQILWVGLLVALAAAAAGWLVGHRTTQRLVRLTDAAEYVSSTGRLDPVGGGEGGGEAGRDEVGRLSSAFDAMLGRLARSKEEQRRLVQDAAHELRTPLTSLYTNVQVLGRVDRLTPEARERLIDDLRGETRELTSLVNELVGLATGEREDEPQSTVVLGDVAERVAVRTRRRTGREITVHADDSTVWGRPSALERAVANPVENAVKFDPEGTAPIEIRVHEGVVEVLDRGPGIAPEQLGRVFERFYRATEARGLPGSGLGLAMVRDIARAHSGDVFARNREGGGAVVGFHLPLFTPPGEGG
uniref:sensor histidine kinase n=1 Tax=Nocardiopsis lucentensis TaxID=53441 RepID=UPI000349A019|nr:HAMP domain-containing sensor histidine kinase [Nocardiopsis lucentensis]